MSSSTPGTSTTTATLTRSMYRSVMKHVRNISSKYTTVASGPATSNTSGIIAAAFSNLLPPCAVISFVREEMNTKEECRLIMTQQQQQQEVGSNTNNSALSSSSQDPIEKQHGVDREVSPADVARCLFRLCCEQHHRQEQEGRHHHHRLSDQQMMLYGFETVRRLAQMDQAAGSFAADVEQLFASAQNQARLQAAPSSTAPQSSSDGSGGDDGAVGAASSEQQQQQQQQQEEHSATRTKSTKQSTGTVPDSNDTHTDSNQEELSSTRSGHKLKYPFLPCIKSHSTKIPFDLPPPFFATPVTCVHYSMSDLNSYLVNQFMQRQQKTNSQEQEQEQEEEAASVVDDDAAAPMMPLLQPTSLHQEIASGSEPLYPRTMVIEDIKLPLPPDVIYEIMLHATRSRQRDDLLILNGDDENKISSGGGNENVGSNSKTRTSCKLDDEYLMMQSLEPMLQVDTPLIVPPAFRQSSYQSRSSSSSSSFVSPAALTDFVRVTCSARCVASRTVGGGGGDDDDDHREQKQVMSSSSTNKNSSSNSNVSEREQEGKGDRKIAQKQQQQQQIASSDNGDTPSTTPDQQNQIHPYLEKLREESRKLKEQKTRETDPSAASSQQQQKQQEQEEEETLKKNTSQQQQQQPPNKTPPARTTSDFSYRIRLENCSENYAVVVLSRHWHFLNMEGSGTVTEVCGPGLVGYMPLLGPHAVTSYDSGTRIASKKGMMLGTFQCIAIPFKGLMESKKRHLQQQVKPRFSQYDDGDVDDVDHGGDNTSATETDAKKNKKKQQQHTNNNDNSEQEKEKEGNNKTGDMSTDMHRVSPQSKIFRKDSTPDLDPVTGSPMHGFCFDVSVGPVGLNCTDTSYRGMPPTLRDVLHRQAFGKSGGDKTVDADAASGVGKKSSSSTNQDDASSLSSQGSGDKKNISGDDSGSGSNSSNKATRKTTEQQEKAKQHFAELQQKLQQVQAEADRIKHALKETRLRQFREIRKRKERKIHERRIRAAQWAPPVPEGGPLKLDNDAVAALLRKALTEVEQVREEQQIQQQQDLAAAAVLHTQQQQQHDDDADGDVTGSSEQPQQQDLVEEQGHEAVTAHDLAAAATADMSSPKLNKDMFRVAVIRDDQGNIVQLVDLNTTDGDIKTILDIHEQDSRRGGAAAAAGSGGSSSSSSSSSASSSATPTTSTDSNNNEDSDNSGSDAATYQPRADIDLLNLDESFNASEVIVRRTDDGSWDFSSLPRSISTQFDSLGSSISKVASSLVGALFSLSAVTVPNQAGGNDSKKRISGGAANGGGGADQSKKIKTIKPNPTKSTAAALKKRDSSIRSLSRQKKQNVQERRSTTNKKK